MSTNPKHSRGGRLRVGTSGFVYRDWRGPVYPSRLPQREWFAHYATLFDTVELRDPSWLHDEVYETLRRHGAALCLHDLLPGLPQILTTDWTYVRFHGPNAREEKYVGEYGGRRLWRVSDRLAAWLDDGNDAYAYFNNDYGGAAVRDAQWLQRRLGLPPPRA